MIQNGLNFQSQQIGCTDSTTGALFQTLKVRYTDKVKAGSTRQGPSTSAQASPCPGQPVVILLITLLSSVLRRMPGLESWAALPLSLTHRPRFTISVLGCVWSQSHHSGCYESPQVCQLLSFRSSDHFQHHSLSQPPTPDRLHCALR